MLWRKTNHAQALYGKEKNVTISGDSINSGISKKGFNKQYKRDCIHSLARRIISTYIAQ